MPTADTLISEIEGFLEESLAAAGDKELIRLEGLEEKVAVLCTFLQAMPKEQAAPYLDKLHGLSGRLVELGQELRRDRDAIQEQLMHLDVRKKANNAYQNSNLIDHTLKPKK